MRPAWGRRLPGLDLARGLAVWLMVAYHFGFDLAYLGLIDADVYGDQRWNAARALILSSFLAVSGISLALAHGRGTRLQAYLVRSARLAGAAGLVTLASYLVFPHSFIVFGVLHFLVLAGLLGLGLLRARVPAPALATLAAVILILHATVEHPLFDHPLLHWIGMMTHRPVTEDYVPVVPWLAVFLLGMWAGLRLAARPAPPAPLARAPRGPLARLAAATGRHSLAIYLLHQPILLGTLWLALRA